MEETHAVAFGRIFPLGSALMTEPLIYTDSGGAHLPILFFIHGWPDTGALWQNQVAYFKKDYRCVCVTLPGFDRNDHSKGGDFPYLVERLVATINKVKGNSLKPVILVGHDWGAQLTYLIDQRHPEIASRVITMEVGPYLRPSSIGHSIFLKSYQWWLLVAYFLPVIGNFMTQAFSKLARTPRRGDVSRRCNYPYFYYWRAKLFKRYRNHLPTAYRPAKPLLYIYGRNKKYHFHTPEWEALVKASPSSSVVGLPGLRHWLQVQDSAGTNKVMEDWLEFTKARGEGYTNQRPK